MTGYFLGTQKQRGMSPGSLRQFIHPSEVQAKCFSVTPKIALSSSSSSCGNTEMIIRKTTGTYL
ncbi:unnamed protein product [Larinioides sclopetarius]|uniref:Uncharacterized protein n=1 Tax=Larinioides sclopetarius TaxID=280406 RepID=A0AAV2B4K6_9ARAC